MRSDSKSPVGKMGFKYPVGVLFLPLGPDTIKKGLTVDSDGFHCFPFC